MYSIKAAIGRAIFMRNHFMPPKKQIIPTKSVDDPIANNPFGTLSIDDIPAAPETRGEGLQQPTEPPDPGVIPLTTQPILQLTNNDTMVVTTSPMSLDHFSVLNQQLSLLRHKQTSHLLPRHVHI